MVGQAPSLVVVVVADSVNRPIARKRAAVTPLLSERVELQTQTAQTRYSTPLPRWAVVLVVMLVRLEATEVPAAVELHRDRQEVLPRRAIPAGRLVTGLVVAQVLVVEQVAAVVVLVPPGPVVDREERVALVAPILLLAPRLLMPLAVIQVARARVPQTPETVDRAVREPERRAEAGLWLSAM